MTDRSSPATEDVPMKVWFDTEFIEDGTTIDLISIGLVREDGATYYAETDQWIPGKASQWVKDNVLVHLKGGDAIKPRDVIAREIVEFAGWKPEFWAYYADYDWIALCQLYGTMMQLPEGWPMFCRDVKQLCVDLGDPTLPTQTSTEHHALSDAKWTKTAWEFLRSYPHRSSAATADDFEALREVEEAWLASEIGRAIANLAYPVGCGAAPTDYHLKSAAKALFNRYSKMIEMARNMNTVAQPSRPAAFLAWAVEMFGPVAKLRSERLMRFIEEAIELAHADQMERTTLDAIANRVYSRAPGSIPHEIGQAQACLETYAENINESSTALAAREWERVQSIPRTEWERRHAAKQALGIALPSTPRATPRQLCSCKASERDGQHMAWCPSLISPEGK